MDTVLLPPNCRALLSDDKLVKHRYSDSIYKVEIRVSGAVYSQHRETLCEYKQWLLRHGGWKTVIILVVNK